MKEKETQIIILPCYGFHRSFGHEEVSSNGFSYPYHQRNRLFVKSNQYLIRLFQQIEICNRKENPKQVSVTLKFQSQMEIDKSSTIAFIPKTM